MTSNKVINLLASIAFAWLGIGILCVVGYAVYAGNISTYWPLFVLLVPLTLIVALIVLATAWDAFLDFRESKQ